MNDLKHESKKDLEFGQAAQEEFTNTLTHALGFLLSLVGTAVLMRSVVQTSDRWQVAGCGIYSFCLVAVYAMSTLSHFCEREKQRSFFRKLDQGFIYLLIVGTYTPFSMTFLRTPVWWIFLAVLWTIALLGFISKVLLGHRVNRVSIWIYVLLGWMPIVSMPYLFSPIGISGLAWMLVGGLCYTLGTIFLIFDHRHRHFHALWHLSVILGSLSHFLVILFYVAGAS